MNLMKSISSSPTPVTATLVQTIQNRDEKHELQNVVCWLTSTLHSAVVGEMFKNVR
jgi:hypothetical protein